MPELPEVETALRGISPYLTHQSVEKVIIRQAQLRWPVPHDLSLWLKSYSVQKCSRRAKYLLLHFEHGTLVIHLGMSGSLRIFRPPVPPPLKHDHIDICFSNACILRYHNPRRFGAMLWFEGDTIPLFDKLGPEPLDEGFTGEYLYQQLKNQNRPIKTALMDNAIVVGVGNIYANECLFWAKIKPSRKAKSLKRKECMALVYAIKRILLRAIETGGSTLKDFVDSEGRSGYFQQEYTVYGRAGEPCKNCNTSIQKTVTGQRGTYFCPKCQR